jgi:hypothetical protein
VEVINSIIKGFAEAQGKYKRKELVLKSAKFFNRI